MTVNVKTVSMTIPVSMKMVQQISIPQSEQHMVKQVRERKRRRRVKDGNGKLARGDKKTRRAGRREKGDE